MDEDAYRVTYGAVNPLQCAFERAILRRCCGCERSIRRNIAEREAAGCDNAEALAQCSALKKQLKHASAFVLKMTHPDDPLPHTKELKLQCGGLLGLEHLHESPEVLAVENIYATVCAAVNEYGSIAKLPYPTIIQSIRAYEPRQRRK